MAHCTKCGRDGVSTLCVNTTPREGDRLMCGECWMVRAFNEGMALTDDIREDSWDTVLTPRWRASTHNRRCQRRNRLDNLRAENRRAETMRDLEAEFTKLEDAVREVRGGADVRRALGACERFLRTYGIHTLPPPPQYGVRLGADTDEEGRFVKGA